MRACSNCRYVHTATGKSACRRFPPQVSYIIVPKPSGLVGGGMVPSEESRSAFPTVREDWSCGEFEARLEVL